MTSFDYELPRRLAELLSAEFVLSARELRQMEPELSYGRHLDAPCPRAKPAAVAVLMYPRGGKWHIPLCVRPEQMKHHGGQVALPGGRVEPGESTAQAALREMEEELGVSRDEPSIIGPLLPINLFVTNFVVHPWVVVMDNRPKFVACEGEVAEILEAPLDGMLSPSAVEQRTQSRNGVHVSAPCYRCDGRAIWGATAILLGQLIDAIKQAPG